MTDEQKVKSVIFEKLLGGLSHQEALFIIDVALQEKTEVLYETLTEEEKQNLLEDAETDPTTFRKKEEGKGEGKEAPES